MNLIDGAALFRWSMNSVKESVPFPYYENVIYEPYPDYNVVVPLCFVYKVFFESSHIDICEVGCNSGSHCCPLDLDKMFVIDSEVVQSQNLFKKACQSLRRWLDPVRFYKLVFIKFLLNDIYL